MTTTYRVSHETRYRYGSQVSVSHHLVHLKPRATLHQHCLESHLDISPEPGVRRASQDYFGNPTCFLTLSQPHKEFKLRAESLVERRPAIDVELELSEAWDGVQRRLREETRPETLEALQFSLPSPMIPLLDPLETYARRSFIKGRPLLAATFELMQRICDDFTYDPKATTVDTPLAKSFALKRGVCQDMAHVMIGCMRSLGLPARYVSGYLMTHAAPGKERLTGADASHAWLAVWDPFFGWVDFDPTNQMIPAQEHITIAFGRDYTDAAPVTGVMYGGGSHVVDVAVDVAPL